MTQYTVLGRLGLKISVLGLGFWQAGSRLWGNRGGDLADRVLKIVETAFNNGVNFYDTAEIYGGGLSEKLLGEAVKKLRIRDEVVIASKIAGYKWSYYSFEKTIKKINNRLQTKVDLIQHHWPPPIYIPICKVVNGLEKLVEKGYTSYYGLSNYGTKDLTRALECARKYEPVSNQVQYNLAYRVAEKKLKKLMEKEKIALIAWSPLAKGALAGLRKPRTWAQRTDPVFLKASKDTRLQAIIGEIASKHGVPRSVVALRWIIEKNAIPIPGTRKPERVGEYALALKEKLDPGEVEALDKASARYIDLWGRDYNALRINRFIPGILQALGITLTRGI